ncbi:MAG TPA: DUF4260 domain-containing protein [Rhodoblastus sp.]|nr:DUF4260 domain-containing protein [Rhodoblastus sp.]
MRPGVAGAPRILLRLEGLAVLAVALLAFVAFDGAAALGLRWWALIPVFLAPDLSMLAYLAGPRIGAIVYNAAHSYVAPLVIGALAFHALGRAPVALCLLWIAHIGFDRALGYGLKYASGFGDTHLGSIGRRRT